MYPASRPSISTSICAATNALTLTEIATRMRGPGKQHVVYVSAVFRDSCEALADHWARRGNRAPR